MGIRTFAMVSLIWCACTDASEPVVNTPRVHVIAEGGGGGGGGGGPTLLASMMATATKCGEINVTWWSYPAGFARLELTTQVGTEPATTRNLQVSATSYDSTNLAQNTSITYTLRAYDAADTFLQQVSTAGKSAACTGTGGNQIGQYLPQNLDVRAMTTAGGIAYTAGFWYGTMMVATDNGNAWPIAIPNAVGGTITANAIAVDATGQIFVAGSFTGSIDFIVGGAYQTEVAKDSDMFIARVNSAGTITALRTMGSATSVGTTSTDSVTAIALDSSAHLAFTGQYTQDIDFGCGAIDPALQTKLAEEPLSPDQATASANPNPVGFVAMLSNDLQTCVWSRSFASASSSGTMGPTGIAIYQPSFLPPRVAVVGWLDGEADFGGGAKTSNGGHDVFVATYESSTASNVPIFRAAQTYGGDGLAQDATGVAYTSGGIYVAGTYEGQLTFGGATPLPEPPAPRPFVARLTDTTTTPTFKWQVSFDSTSGAGANAIAVSGTTIAVAAIANSAIDFKGGMLYASSGAACVVVLKDGNSPSATFSRCASRASASVVALDATSATPRVVIGGVVLTAYGFTFGATPLYSSGGYLASFAW